jgi:amino acid adenylation domain-containing protein
MLTHPGPPEADQAAAPAELEQLTRAAWARYNDSATRYPFEGGLVRWLEEAIAAHPDRPAVQVADDQLTFGELDRRARAVTSFLRARGVAGDSIVGIAADRSVHGYVAILAVLRAGCGYLPIDPADPADRQRFVLQDAGAVALLSAAQHCDKFEWLPPELDVRGVLGGPGPEGFGWLRCDDPATATGPAMPAEPDPYRAERIRYIIYTSGTTGRPKGVRISEGSLLNFVHWYQQRHGVQSRDRLCQTAPLTFDPSVQQIFPAWVSGACLLPVPDHELHDPFALLAWLRQERISHLDVVTAHWQHLREAAEQSEELRQLPDLRWIIIGGETLHYPQSHHWYRIISSPALLNNIYGPTEATINASEYVVEAGISSGQIPIGAPLPNYRLYVVDDQGRLCAPGQVGHLLIAGDGLASGYQSAEATTAAFGTLDVGDGQVERIYRSGDLAKLIEHPSHGWTLEFRGRTDTQVKIRGFRIELGEIEAAAESCPGVRAAAVLLRREPADQLICCYQANGELQPATVRAHLARRLAGSQLPNMFLRLEQFPLTRNGKLDSAELARIANQMLAERQGQGQQPDGELETTIAEVWCAVLGIGAVGRDEDFFQIGGDSLLTLTLLRQLRERGIDLLAADVFERPTVAALATRCQQTA